MYTMRASCGRTDIVLYTRRLNGVFVERSYYTHLLCIKYIYILTHRHLYTRQLCENCNYEHSYVRTRGKEKHTSRNERECVYTIIHNNNNNVSTSDFIPRYRGDRMMMVTPLSCSCRLYTRVHYY